MAIEQQIKIAIEKALKGTISTRPISIDLRHQRLDEDDIPYLKPLLENYHSKINFIFSEDQLILLVSNEVLSPGSYDAYIKSAAIYDFLKQGDDGYFADMEEEIEKISKERKSKTKYRSRLLLGEGDFSYAHALMVKHPELGDSLLATEIRSLEELQETYGNTVDDNVNAIHSLGAKILFGTDATKIHEEFEGQRFKRIHFNFPYIRPTEEEKKANPTPTGKLVLSFFFSAAKVQKPGDQIHMAIVEKKHVGYDESKGGADRLFWQGTTYNIVKSSVSAGYQFIKKRKFTEGLDKRYPGYIHKATSHDDSSQNATNSSREYIFEKIEGDRKKITQKYIKEKITIADIVYSHKQLAFSPNYLPTSSGSSTYEDSSEDLDQENIAVTTLNDLIKKK